MYTADEMDKFRVDKIICTCGHDSISHFWYYEFSNECKRVDCECTQFTPVVTASGPVEGIVTNAAGGKQSDVDYAFHAMPAEAILEVSRILKTGLEKYGKDNWKRIPIEEHINHSIGHMYKYMVGDATEEHLGNAACRALFTLQLFLEQTAHKSKES